MIDLYAWLDVPNFGDAMSLPLLGLLTGGRAFRIVPMNVTPKLIAMGSVLYAARTGDTIWGTGVHPNMLRRPRKHPLRAKELDLLSVRGPITREYLLKHGFDCPRSYLDPARLLPQVWEGSIPSRHGMGFVTHYLDKEGERFAERCKTKAIGAGTTDWEQVVDFILQCDIVASSSLHGIIVAEAFGIPAIWVYCKEGRQKYDDYYQGTYRQGQRVSWEDVDTTKPVALPECMAKFKGMI